MRMKNEGRVCGLDGCDLPAKKRGYCETHYQRFRIRGDASVVLSKPNGTLYKWVLDHVNYSEDGCLEWPFSKDTHGRGQLFHKGGMKKAPRVMCEEAHGAPPTPEHQAAHSCGNGHLGCIHPGHLSWKTRKDNEKDKIEHGTIRRGEIAWNARLTADVVLEIHRRAQTEQCKTLASEFGLHPGTISQIKRKKRWSHLFSDMGDDAAPFATAVINQWRIDGR